MPALERFSPGPVKFTVLADSPLPAGAERCCERVVPTSPFSSKSVSVSKNEPEPHLLVIFFFFFENP